MKYSKLTELSLILGRGVPTYSEEEGEGKQDDATLRATEEAVKYTWDTCTTHAHALLHQHTRIHKVNVLCEYAHISPFFS